MGSLSGQIQVKGCIMPLGKVVLRKAAPSQVELLKSRDCDTWFLPCFFPCSNARDIKLLQIYALTLARA